MKTKIYSYLGARFAVRVPDYSGMLGVKAGRALVTTLKNVVILARGAVTRSWVVIIVVFLSTINRIRKSQGLSGSVKYLKGCQVLLMQGAAGQKHAGAQLLGPGVKMTHSGLPRIIPATHRDLIRKGSVSTLRVWLSLFGLYRVIEFPGKVKLATITSPGVTIPKEVNDDLFASFTRSWSLLVTSFGAKLPVIIGGKLVTGMKASFFPIYKASPTSFYGSISIQIWTLTAAAFSLVRSSIASDYMTLATLLGSKVLTHLAWGLLTINAIMPEKAKALTYGTLKRDLGKIGFRVEPAGKIRAFAIVDPFTQWLLHPLHKWVFQLLRLIPQDGTHDQLAPLTRMLTLLQEKKMTKVFSFDLSAATDRLPISLQKEILVPILTRKGVEAWANLLVGRDYVIVAADRKAYGLKETSVRYAVGQPMGAYSSWAMLALTHHFLVQYSAYRAIGTTSWFDLYAVLGDDVVIGHPLVAKEYQRIMAQIGVEIGLAKSVISRNGSCEFAKRYFWKFQDASPVSFKEVGLLSNPVILLELLRKFHLRVNYRLSHLLSLAGYGFRAKSRVNTAFAYLPKRLAAYLLLSSRPDSGLPWSFKTWSDWLLSYGLVAGTVIPDRLVGLLLLIREVLIKPTAKLVEDLAVFSRTLESWKIRAIQTPKGVPDILATVDAGRAPEGRRQDMKVKLLISRPGVENGPTVRYDAAWANVFKNIVYGCAYTVMFAKDLSDIRALRAAWREFKGQFDGVTDPGRAETAINSLVSTMLEAERLVAQMPTDVEDFRNTSKEDVHFVKADRLTNFRLALRRQQTIKPTKSRSSSRALSTFVGGTSTPRHP